MCAILLQTTKSNFKICVDVLYEGVVLTDDTDVVLALCYMPNVRSRTNACSKLHVLLYTLEFLYCEILHYVFLFLSLSWKKWINKQNRVIFQTSVCMLIDIEYCGLCTTCNKSGRIQTEYLWEPVLLPEPKYIVLENSSVFRFCMCNFAANKVIITNQCEALK